MAQKPVHATCIAAPPGDGPVPGAWAVLLRGPSGAGKSDLALRLIDRGWRLVADDRTALRAAGSRLLASAPASIAGRLEVRGLGILELPRLEEAAVCLAVDLAPGVTVERLPEAETCRLVGIELPLLRLDPFEVSAPVKLNLAMHRAASVIMGQAGVPAGGGPNAPAHKRRKDHRNMPDGVAKTRQATTPAVEMRRVVLVTGLSGAGRTSALDSLEDLGYEAINNPPLDLLGEIIGTGSPRPIAVGVDIRTRDFSAEPLLEQLDRLRCDPALSVSLLFVDCDDEVLRQRYSETRRRHPLARERPIIDGISAERRLVSPLRARADLVIDTSGLRLADLGRILAGHLGLEDAGALAVFVTSFAYRSGLPRGADLVFDVRFLDNPYYEPALRERTGRDQQVIEFVRADPGFEPFFGHLTDMLEPLLPRYQREGKSYLTIAIGCTGGRHRSVMVAEHLAPWIEQKGYKVTLVHREIGVE